MSMRYFWRNEVHYHLLPGRPDGRTACGMVVMPERGDEAADERPEGRELCGRCASTKEPAWAK